MTDEQHEVAPQPDIERMQAEGKRSALLALGVVFFAIGGSGAVRGEPWSILLPVGIVFLVLAYRGARKASARRRRKG